jgi:hypothetical protein
MSKAIFEKMQKKETSLDLGIDLSPYTYSTPVKGQSCGFLDNQNVPQHSYILLVTYE